MKAFFMRRPGGALLAVLLLVLTLFASAPPVRA